MPNIRISGLPSEKVQILSKELTSKLSETIGVAEGALSFYAGDEKIFRNGELLSDSVYIYFGWFDKGSDIKAKVVALLTETIKGNAKLGLEKIEIVRINFEELITDNYYKNGMTL